MDAAQTLAYVALGALLGATGQTLRVIVGIKKELDEARAQKAATNKDKDWFNPGELWVSLLLGAAAGVAAALTQYGPTTAISKELMMALAAAGYSGADFIEGIAAKWLPKG